MNSKKELSPNFWEMEENQVPTTDEQVSRRLATMYSGITAQAAYGIYMTYRESKNLSVMDAWSKTLEHIIAIYTKKIEKQEAQNG